MFFAKTSKDTALPKTEITIIGTSPQAFFIGDMLQNNNCSITFLVPESKISQYVKNFSLTLRPSGFQNRRAEFSFTTSIKKIPSFVFLTSNPEDTKNDLLLLTEPRLKNIPVINLSFAYNNALLTELVNSETFPAFLDGQFLFEKNILTFINRPQNIEVFAPVDIINKLKNIFENTLNINKSASLENLFWQNFIPVFLGNLIIQAYNQNISSCLNNPQNRHLIDHALKELSALSKKEKNNFDTSKALTTIYSFADSYLGEFTTPQRLNVLANVLPQINRFDTPALFELLSKALKKY